jgi:hypothetical protein
MSLGKQGPITRTATLQRRLKSTDTRVKLGCKPDSSLDIVAKLTRRGVVSEGSHRSRATHRRLLRSVTRGRRRAIMPVTVVSGGAGRGGRADLDDCRILLTALYEFVVS